MRKVTRLVCALFVLAGFGWQTASAQFPTEIKIPRPGRPKPKPAESTRPAPATNDTRPATQPRQNTPAATAAQEPAGGPTIIKTRVQFEAKTINSYKGNYDVWSWHPKAKFRTVGPTPSGAHYYLEVSQPGGAPWVKIDCESAQGGADHECGVWRGPEDKTITAVGPVNFAIKMRNELAGADATLFTGRAKVEKVSSNEHGPKAANKFVYFVNQDWNLPIGQVMIADNKLNVRFWVRGEAHRLEAHAFHQGKEVGRIFTDGIQTAAPVCRLDIEINPSISVAESVPQGAKWRRVQCTFPALVDQPTNNSELFALSANPGEYEVKVLRGNKLARSVKFTVGRDGKIVDNGLVAANKLGGSGFIVVPVTILDDQDGPWDRTAWKTEAFYGNPLTGFTPPQ